MTSSLSFSSSKPLPPLASRYAGAFYDLADERGQLPMVEADLKALAAMLKESADLKILIANPLVRRKDMVRALEGLFEGAKFSALSRQFMQVVVGNGRARDIPAILSAFFARAAEAKGEVVAKVASARALNDEEKRGVEAAVVSALSARGVKTVKLRETVDATLMGGVRVQVGSWMFDGSIKGRLASLGRQLKA